MLVLACAAATRTHPSGTLASTAIFIIASPPA
jgi:hypothetical protein